jgi:hypothetical protein
VGSFFFLLPPTVAMVLASGGGVVSSKLGWDLHWGSLSLGREGWLRDHLRWV